MNPQTQTRLLRIGHSPDPDDAFMWYPLAHRGEPVGLHDATADYTPLIDTGSYKFVHILEDIQSLNDRAERAELEITALSIHQYPYIAKDYALTSCGSSMGDGYGPMVVVPEHSPIQEVSDLTRPGVTVAIPGRRTTAYLALQLLLAESPSAPAAIGSEVVMFDQIIPAVAAGRFDAGLIIHEGQLTYGTAGLRCVADLGQWWKQTRQLPLPLGGNAIRRDLATEMKPICAVLLRSIQYALEHRPEAIQYALNYARDMGADLADRFVGMYVNQWTLDYGSPGRQAVCRLLKEAQDHQLVPPFGEIDFIDPA